MRLEDQRSGRSPIVRAAACTGGQGVASVKLAFGDSKLGQSLGHALIQDAIHGIPVGENPRRAAGVDEQNVLVRPPVPA